jgi:hypothetical protein
MEKIQLQIKLLPSEMDSQRWGNVLHIRERKSSYLLNMGVRKPSRHSRNRKKQCTGEYLVYFVMFWSFRALFL